MPPSDIDAFQRERVLYLTTVGRKTGQAREIEIWFVTYQGRFYLVAERGHNAQWVRNIQANPDVSVRIKQHQFRACGRILDAEHDRQEWDAVAHLALRKYGWGEGLPVAIDVQGADLAASKLGSRDADRGGGSMEETASQYVFRASAAPLVEVAPGLKWKEAQMLEGMIVRYQERGPQSVARDWCETGHTAFIVSGRLRYEFADHSVVVGPGDIVHIPAGPAHRHRPHVEGQEAVRYFITEFR